MHVGPRHFCPAVSLHTLPESAEALGPNSNTTSPPTLSTPSMFPCTPSGKCHRRCEFQSHGKRLLHSRMQSSYARAGICTVPWTDLRVGWRRRYSFQHLTCISPPPVSPLILSCFPSGVHLAYGEYVSTHQPCLPILTTPHFTHTSPHLFP